MPASVQSLHPATGGVGTLDAVSYVTACVALAVAGLSACAIPARRATKLDPVLALRAE